jgi:hypothetical protein
MHRGLDGRLYMLDLARSMPPEDPDVSMYCIHTLRLITLCIVHRALIWSTLQLVVSMPIVRPRLL